MTPLSGWCLEGAKIVEICQKGDALLAEEINKVYKGKKISKGISHPTTVSPSSYVTPYTPLVSDTEEANTTLKPNEVIKIQLGAQIDGFGTIVCDSVIIPSSSHAHEEGKIPTRQADLLLATYWANELLLRLMIPPGLLAGGSDAEKAKAQKERSPTQARITQLLEKVAQSFNCNIVESTTSWLFERNEIEGPKKIILAPSEGVKGEGIPEVGEVWGVEMAVSMGTGKCKTLENRPTLLRRTTTTYQLKRPSSRQTLTEIVDKFKTFPFSLRQLSDERAAKIGVLESVRAGVLRQYDVAGDKDNEPVARLLSTVGKLSDSPNTPIATGAIMCLRYAPGTNTSVQLSRRMACKYWQLHRSLTLVSLLRTTRSETKRSSRFSRGHLPAAPARRTKRRRRRQRSLRQIAKRRAAMMTSKGRG